MTAPTDQDSPSPSKASAPAADIKENWGTRRRLDAHLSLLDQGGLDELMDRALKTGGAPRFLARYHPQATWLWRQRFTYQTTLTDEVSYHTGIFERIAGVWHIAHVHRSTGSPSAW